MKSGMSELHSILVHLNTDLVGNLPEPGTKDHQKVEVRMERLARLTHRITPQKEMNGVGQLYSILGVALPEQADQMTSAWRLGQTTYSRALFRTAWSVTSQADPNRQYFDASKTKTWFFGVPSIAPVTSGV
jgi:hypothetical protein